ncbi:MAG: bifunctional diguanylate cyclase/phosphodiesterase [Deltaproteobacteria bacterium]|jgi:diguanylate cyclase (GGDEF)-like protein|nr:bifunctional diguanylate cyclase/phosphodiesterase [Deltaproteobacteria bacterium]
MKRLPGAAAALILAVFSLNLLWSGPAPAASERSLVTEIVREDSVAEAFAEVPAGREMDELLVEALPDNRPATLSEVIKRNPLIAFMLLAGVVGAAMLSLLAVLWYRSRTLRRVREQLYIDQLTGKWSAHRFRKEAEHLLKTSPGRPFAVIYLDINSLKYINDVYGYAAGDRTLKSVADYLVRNLRPGEIAARIMADHFALLLRDWSEQTQSRLQYILHDVRHIEQIQQFQISTSAGVYVRSGWEMDISAMLDKANYARGAAKRGLADVAVLYDESIREGIRAEKEIENVMLAALRRGEFEPYFQPKVDMFTGRMVGAEALVRWLHPDKGLIPPQQFIPLFEKNGFIVDLDLYICEQVCHLLQRWQTKFSNLKPISCNFSRLHIRNSQFQNSLETIAALYNVPPHILELEITESVAMENIETLVALMFNLQKNGFRITIDDFGSGYSSLGLLQKLPANTLKLDKSFVEDIVNHRDQVIVKGVVDIAQKLNMDVVCEGIETYEQAEFLQSVNCRIAQGYYYSRPLRTHDFEKFMEATL